MNKIKKLTQKYENILTKLKADYLTNFVASTSNFYGFPKIHESAFISEAIAKQNNEYVEVLESRDLKLRPIAAGPTCPTRPLNDLLDKIIKPFILLFKSYVRDNVVFLERLGETMKTQFQRPSTL